MSNMVCVTCDNPVDSCVCQDVDARLKRVAFMPDGLVAFKWCRACDKYYGRCKCEQPDFFVVLGGQEVSVSR